MIRKLLITLLTLVAASIYAQTPIVIPASQFPVKTNMLDGWRLIIVDAVNNTNYTIAWSNVFKAVTNGTGVFVKDVSPVDASIGVVKTTNSSGVFVTISNNVAGSVSLSEGYQLRASSTAANTNTYQFDFGRTNSRGQLLIYGTLFATNDVKFTGTSNGVPWIPQSFNVLASGGNRTVYVPSTTSHFITNNWTLSGTAYKIIITNGNELRMTFQSQTNISGTTNTSVTWNVFPQ